MIISILQSIIVEKTDLIIAKGHLIFEKIYPTKSINLEALISQVM
jgi:hypothetical protein